MENPRGQKREMSPYNKFMQLELQRQKDMYPEKDHRQCFKAAATAWQTRKNEVLDKNQPKKIHRPERKTLLKNMKLNDMDKFDASMDVLCNQFGMEVLPDLTNLSDEELNQLHQECVIKTYILQEQRSRLLTHRRQ